MYSFHVQSPGFVSHLAALVDGPQPVQQDGYVGCYREQMNSFGLSFIDLHLIHSKFQCFICNRQIYSFALIFFSETLLHFCLGHLYFAYPHEISAFHCVLTCRSTRYAMLQGKRCMCVNEPPSHVSVDGCDVHKGTHYGLDGSVAVYRRVKLMLTH